MAVKQLAVEGVGTITFQKRRGAQNIRIHIQGHRVKVTLPHWVPYQQAVAFAASRHKWINEHRGQQPILTVCTYIGKSHQLRVTKNTNNIQTRVKGGYIDVKMPEGASNSTEAVRKVEAAVLRALHKESKSLVLPRVSDIALEHEFTYRSVSFKKLRSRWGSCDKQNNLVFNIYLVQLPWDIIDYVIVHELVHTKHHNHSRGFWATLATIEPNYKAIIKRLKVYHPYIIIEP